MEYDKSLGYFNAGVCLINLAYWREHHIGQQCLDYLKDNYSRIVYNDQDVLNYVLRELKILLPLTYNYQQGFLLKAFHAHYPQPMIDEILKTTNPVIIHYAGEAKPWMINGYLYPYRDLWISYKKKSLWRRLPEKMIKRKRFNYIVKRFILWPLGLMKNNDFIKI